MKPTTAAAGCLVLTLAALAGFSGCETQAEPLEVTYYYLPG